MTDHQPTLSKGRFLIELPTVAFLLTAGVLAWLGWSTYHSYHVTKMARERDFRIEELRGTIIYLDEVLTMSARMAAATGAPQWEERYRRFEPKLDAAIKEAIKLAPEAHSGEDAAQTDVANTALVEMENRTFDLVRQGRLENAQSILFSDGYEKQKQKYAEGMERFAAHLAKRTAAGMESDKNRVLLHLTLAGGVIVVLLAAWMLILRALRNQNTLLLETNSQLAQQAMVLKETTVSRSYLDNIINSMVDTLIVLTPDGTLERANQSLLNLLGYEADELIGQPMAVIFGDETLTPADLQGGRSRAETTYLTKDGGDIWISLSSSPIRIDGGAEGVVCVGQDITEQRRLESERQRFVTLVENSSDFIAMAAPDGNMLYINEAGARLVGLDGTSNIKSKQIFDFHPKTAQAHIQEQILPALTSEGHWQGEIAFRHLKTDTHIPVHLNAFLMIEPSTGQPIAMAVIARDMRAIRESEARFRALFESTGVGIVVGGPGGKLLQANPAFQQMLGYTAKELAQMTLIAVSHPEERETSGEFFRELVEGKRDYAWMEKRYLHKDSSVEAVYDQEVALERVEGDIELLLDVAEMFIEDAPQMLSELRQAIDARDADTLNQAAHRLKGAVANFGAKAAYDAALRLEIMGQDGVFADVETTYTVLEQEIERLTAALVTLRNGEF